jgi:parallel beta-helix repeat protein
MVRGEMAVREECAEMTSLRCNDGGFFFCALVLFSKRFFPRLRDTRLGVPGRETRMLAKRLIRGSYARRAALLCIVFLLFGSAVARTSAQNVSIATAQRAGAVALSALTSITVNTTSDLVDGATSSFDALSTQPGAGGAISLREAVTASNNITTTTPLTILFNIPTADPGYDSATNTWAITLGAAALPTLTRGNVTIDGSSQPGDPGRPQIVLDGFAVFEVPDFNNAFTITSSHNTIRGLTLLNFYDHGVLLTGPNASDNRIVGCYLGPTASGGMAGQQTTSGVGIRDSAHHNTIGGSGASSRNLISGNYSYGVWIADADTRNNIVAGNWIGTGPNGKTALGNGFTGVMISGGAHDNTVNGGNVISGNLNGIFLSRAVATTIAGNIIGLANDRRTPLGNRDGGMLLVAGARDNLIGGTSTAARNIISSNGENGSQYGQGIYISDAATMNNVVQGNYIGVDSSGILPAGNYRQGVLIAAGAHDNSIGGTTAGAANVIAYNGLGGVRIDAPNNQVAGNLIGVGADGTTQLGNQFNGVRIAGNGNTVGPNNTISFNQHSGVLLAGGSTTVLSNTIDWNGRSGICAAGAGSTIRGNEIVHNGPGAGPWPECSIRGGIVITSTNDILVADNRILANNDAGVTILGGSGNSLLGNSISDNNAAGIRLGPGANDNVQPPRLNGIAGATITGRSCALCRVEVFTDSSDEGRVFVGSTTAAADGSFSMQLMPPAQLDAFITATHTNASGSTSAFAASIRKPSDAPTPSPTPEPTPRPTPLPNDPSAIFLPMVFQ